MSPPSRMAMARPIAGLPLTRNMGCGGSAKPRRIVAMSRRRIMRPLATKLMLRRSSSDSKAPVTRSSRFSLPVWMVPAGLHDVLRLKGGDQRRAVDPEAGELFHRELDEDPLVLRAQHLDLRHVGDLQQARSDILDMIAQLARGKSVGGESIDDPEGVAELVVETWPDDAGRQCMPHVADALADVVPDVRHLAGRCLAFQVDEDGGQAGAGVAAQEVEVRRLLQRALDALGDLQQRVVDRGAWPGGLHDHRLDDEGRILVATEAR